MSGQGAHTGRRIFVPPLGARGEIVAIAAATLVMVVWFLGEWLAGFWDWLLLSGWCTYVFAFLLARTIPDRLEYTLSRLADRSALVATPEQLERFCMDLEDRAVSRWAPAFGIVVALALAASTIFVMAPAFQAPSAFATSLDSVASILSTVAILLWTLAYTTFGYIAGCYLGRGASYGLLGARLESEGLPVRMMAGHPDGVGGLKPIGDFFFYQAMIVAIPAVFLAAWLFLFSLPQFQEPYSPWQKPVMGLLALVVFFEILAFILPLLQFHRVMVRQKSDLLRDADKLSIKIAEIERRLSEGPLAERPSALQDLTHMTERFQTIEKLPVWPVDPATKWRFGLNNFLLLIPVISQVTGLSKKWEELLTALGRAAAS